MAREIVRTFAEEMGRAIRKRLEAESLENTPENYWAEPNPIALYWRPSGGGYVERSETRIVKEFTFCPVNDGFKALGPAAEELGEVYCDMADEAVWAGFNPDWEVTREKTFVRDGVCRLVWTRKTGAGQGS